VFQWPVLQIIIDDAKTPTAVALDLGEPVD
jgi:hypothetical protein